MKFCQPHWDKLREAINARGLGDLIAPDGETAVQQMVSQLETEKASPTNFDPLMSAHWAIVNTAMQRLEQVGGPQYALSLMFADEAGADRCPICYLRAEHAAHCDDPRCEFDKDTAFEDWIEFAANDAVEQWEKIKADAA